MKKLVSDCHNAEIKLGGTGTTHWFFCSKCIKACGVHEEVTLRGREEREDEN